MVLQVFLYVCVCAAGVRDAPTGCLGVTEFLRDLTLMQTFYINFRRALTHPCLNDATKWHSPTNMEEWKKYPSRKLDAVAHIVKHHLELDNRLPLAVNEIGELQPVEGPQYPGPPDLPCDKIVIYSAWPSSNEYLLQVYSTALYLHDDMSNMVSRSWPFMVLLSRRLSRSTG